MYRAWGRDASRAAAARALCRVTWPTYLKEASRSHEPKFDGWPSSLPVIASLPLAAFTIRKERHAPGRLPRRVELLAGGGGRAGRERRPAPAPGGGGGGGLAAARGRAHAHTGEE